MALLDESSKKAMAASLSVSDHWIFRVMEVMAARQLASPDDQGRRDWMQVGLVGPLASDQLSLGVCSQIAAFPVEHGPRPGWGNFYVPRSKITVVHGHLHGSPAELCGEKISSQCMTTLRGIIASTEWMDQLITSLLTLSGISRSELNLESVDLSEMARVIAAELRLSQPERRATFAIAEGGTAHGDANLLRLAMANLLGNAWKYTARTEAAVIEFGVNESEGERTYFVRDNGIGFDMGQAGRLFAPFQRLHGAREYEGHGIGLATVQRIVQRHGGRVWAEGEVGRGATFCFTLPPEEPPPVSS